jgi:hypothetical protein
MENHGQRQFAGRAFIDDAFLPATPVLYIVNGITVFSLSTRLCTKNYTDSGFMSLGTSSATQLRNVQIHQLHRDLTLPR